MKDKAEITWTRWVSLVAFIIFNVLSIVSWMTEFKIDNEERNALTTKFLCFNNYITPNSLLSVSICLNYISCFISCCADSSRSSGLRQCLRDVPLCMQLELQCRCAL